MAAAMRDVEAAIAEADEVRQAVIAAVDSRTGDDVTTYIPLALDLGLAHNHFASWFAEARAHGYEVD
jgi:hypothetical protein